MYRKLIKEDRNYQKNILSDRSDTESRKSIGSTEKTEELHTFSTLCVRKQDKYSHFIFLSEYFLFYE